MEHLLPTQLNRNETHLMQEFIRHPSVFANAPFKDEDPTETSFDTTAAVTTETDWIEYASFYAFLICRQIPSVQWRTPSDTLPLQVTLGPVRPDPMLH